MALLKGGSLSLKEVEKRTFVFIYHFTDLGITYMKKWKKEYLVFSLGLDINQKGVILKE